MSRSARSAGVPFAVKNLFDVAGLATLAGSKINREHAPAKADATLIARMEAAGAVLVGALNMGEYAYDFTGENVHDGPSRNPHDTGRMTGGSSGGSGGAVAGGLVPISLGSDTNGSIRVPSSLCGLFGLKPTYGRLSRARTFPFVASLDHLGPLARSTRDLTLAYDAMQGYDADDPVCAKRPVEPASPSLEQGISGLRIVVAGGYFQRGAFPEALQAVDRIAKALGATRIVELPEAARARAAAYVITATEGAAPASGAAAHSRRRFRSGRARPADRRRDAAGVAGGEGAEVPPLVPRRRWRSCSTASMSFWRPPRPAARRDSGRRRMVLDGAEMPLRPNIGIYTQPISFIGLPVVAVPVAAASRCRSGCRSSPRRGARTWRCASLVRWRPTRCAVAPRPQQWSKG